MKLKYIKNPILLGFIALLFLSFALIPYLFEPGIANAKPVGAYLNGVFPTSTPTGSITADASYHVENAFPNLTFIDPVDMLELPNNNELLVLGLQGHIWKFTNDHNTSSKQLLLDISDNVVNDYDGGMLGIVLHPEYGQAGSPNSEYIYVFYRYTPVQGTDRTGPTVKGYMRLSRFNLPLGATAINPSSEEVLINIYDRHDWHNGGDMFFGPNDGFLYLVVGDEGAAYDSYGVTQQIDKWLFGGVLRIDVDQRGGNISHPIRKQPLNAGTPPNGWPNSFTQGYYIPNDNPWLNSNGSILEEFYAIGTRSPHRMTLDAETGDIWIGDIGQGAKEEISIVRKGDNLQWPYREGDQNGFRVKPNPLIGTDRPPIHAYGRSTGRAVIGGFVYRGDKFPELKGKYLFGDHETQDVWTLTKTGENTGDVNYLLNVPVNGVGFKDGISSFFTDSNENIYILDLFGTAQDGGVIQKMVRSGGATLDPPQKLSDLNVFTDLQNLTPIDGIIPYDVNAPLWSDGAKKRRWIALPNDGNHNTALEQIDFENEENWSFPPGTVAIKQFDLPTDANDPSKLTKLETRFLIFTENNVAYAVTYKWNEEQTDAFLIGIDEEVAQDYQVKQSDGSIVDQTWNFPSRSQCIQCHNSVAGYALGLKTRQLNKDYLYPSTGIESNQLDTWDHLNMFGKKIALSAELPASVSIDAGDEVSSEMKVRSYIDANCAYCHRPNGVEGAFDGRALTALYDQAMINTDVVSHASISGYKIVVPQDAENSMLYIRDGSESDDRMPPVGRNLTDEDYLQELIGWIEGLDLDGPEALEEGSYTLQARHSDKFLAVEDASNSEGAQVVQISSNIEENTKWTLKNMGNSKFRIVAGSSNMVLSLQDLRTDRGSSVVQETWNGGQQQLWYFEETDDDYFRIRNVYNGLELDVAGASIQENAHTMVWTQENSTNQQWKLAPTTPPEPLCPSPVEARLSDLAWESVQQGWGTTGKNVNLTGGTITINDRTFEHGLATHAQSEIVYDLSGGYRTFTSYIGIDDTAPGTSSASVQFEVFGDGASLFRSGTMKASDDARLVEVDISGMDQLRLVVHELPGESPSIDPDANDHADWAGALLISCGEIPEPEPLCPSPVEARLSDLAWESVQQGWGTTGKNVNLTGGTITINDRTFEHGLATHAQSEIVYDLSGGYRTFTSYIGIDDTAPGTSSASVQFEVFGDGASLFRSGTMRASDDARLVEVDISGMDQLRLVVHELPGESPSVDPDSYDHADWAGATLISCGENLNSLSATAILQEEIFYFTDVSTQSASHLVDVKWTTSNEKNIEEYIVERSVDGHNFVVVGDQPGLRSNKRSSYSGYDSNPVIGKSVYRIIAVSNEGERTYSHSVEVNFEVFNTKVLVYPNPVDSSQKLTADIFVTDGGEEDLTMTIYSADGKSVYSRTTRMKQPQAFEQFNVANLQSGTYILQVTGRDWSRSQRFVVR